MGHYASEMDFRELYILAIIAIGGLIYSLTVNNHMHAVIYPLVFYMALARIQPNA